MDKQEIYAFLTGRGTEYEVTEHGAVFNMVLHLYLYTGLI